MRRERKIVPHFVGKTPNIGAGLTRARDARLVAPGHERGGHAHRVTSEHVAGLGAVGKEADALAVMGQGTAQLGLELVDGVESLGGARHHLGVLLRGGDR
jgi:hypothetical protein